MGILSNNPFVGLGTKGTGYQINQSLRFDGSAYLNRTPASAGNRRTWTLSFWFKRGKLGTSQNLFTVSDNYGSPSSANYFYIAVSDADDKMYVAQVYPTYNTALDFSPNGRVFRDPSAWYHVVLAIDTTQATGSNRQKMWINGELQTLVNGTSGGPTTISQNYDTTVNTTNEHRLGRYTSGYWDGYLAEVNFIDGTALTPASFGETDTITGAWIPKKYSGSFGTNGFYLQFQASGIGTDSSGNGNTWTANNFVTSGTGTDVMSDTPTNNYATLNATVGTTSNGSATLSDGNLICSVPRLCSIDSTFGVTSGKYYWEVTATDLTNSPYGMGIFATGYGIHHGSTNYLILTNTGSLYTPGDSDNKGNGWGPTYNGSTDVIGLALDMNNYTLGFNKNGGSFTTYDFSAYISSYKMADVTPCWKAGGNLGSSGATFNFGQRAFAYTPPTGYKALNTANLPEPTIKKGSNYFDTKLYTGTNATLNVTGFGFSPDLVWTKARSEADQNVLCDAVRGASNRLFSNLTNAEAGNGLVSLNSDGFTLGDASTSQSMNNPGQTYVAWAWDANGAGSSNTAGSITSTVSANATAGFSIVTYTGNGTAGATVGHGLGVAPKLIIPKSRTGTAPTNNWHCYHASLGATQGILLNATNAAATDSGYWNNTAPTSSVITLGTYNSYSGQDYVAYCFSEVAGYSKFGSYTGNGSTDGPFVACNFRPRWVLTKRTDSTSAWYIHDTVRNTYNVCNNALSPDLADAEVTANNNVDILSNGFKLKTTGAWMNASGGTYIFAAFSETAFKYSNAR